MKKTQITTLLFSLFVLMANAQNEMDALRYSTSEPGGTARFTSMAGAFGALGGDFSSLSINPGGLGIYRSSEISITPSLNYNNAKTKLFETSDESFKYGFNLNNIGVVIAIPTGNKPDEGGWQYVNLGFGLNRHNNFNQEWVARGFNQNSSLMTSFLEQAVREGSIDNLEDFTTGLAWDTYLLDMDDGNFFVDMPNGKVMQVMEVSSSGSIRELVASLAANYNDRFYLGASIGLPSVIYNYKSVYGESDSENLSEYFNSLTYTNKYTTRGSGFNFKIGGIARIGNMVRLGAALHTPTFFKLEDEFTVSMRSNLNEELIPGYTDENKLAEEDGYIDYELTTPLKAIGSVGLIFGASGLLSFDYEYINYSTARLHHDEFSLSDANHIIKNNLNKQNIFRLGGEIRLEPVALRAGYAYYSNPYKEGVNESQRSVLSAGFGLRDKNYSVDFSYAYSFYSEDYALYLIENPSTPLPIAERDFSASIFRITLGWRF